MTPRRPPRPCAHPGCGALTTAGRCEKHKRASWEADRQRGNRHQRGYGAEWEKLREIVLRRDNYLCQPCLRDGKLTAVITGNPRHPHAANVDHVKPKAQGGTDDPANLETTCLTCHKAKTAREGRGTKQSGGGDAPGPVGPSHLYGTEDLL